MTGEELYGILLKKAMALCAGRELCISDMTHKLLSWGADENTSQRIIRQLTGDKFIDEERFSTAFTKDKFRNNKWGKVKIAHALKIKKIDGEIIARSLNTIDDDTYLEMLNTLITSRKKTIKAKNRYDLRGKLLRYGLSKGFESHLLYDLLNDSG